MKKLLLALFAVALAACSMTQPPAQNLGNCMETGLGTDCSATP